jgi:hypothetical protein
MNLSVWIGVNIMVIVLGDVTEHESVVDPLLHTIDEELKDIDEGILKDMAALATFIACICVNINV